MYITQCIEARLVNIEGRHVIPGLSDSHGHIMGRALGLLQVDLSNTSSKEEVLNTLLNYNSNMTEGDWLVAFGWNNERWTDQSFPSKEDLDASFPHTPLLLRRIDGHCIWYVLYSGIYTSPFYPRLLPETVTNVHVISWKCYIQGQ